MLVPHAYKIISWKYFVAQWSWNYIADFKISKHNLVTHVGIGGPAICRKECLLKSGCKSIVYRLTDKTSNGVCSLKSASRLEVVGKSAWVYSKGDHYYDFYHKTPDQGMGLDKTCLRIMNVKWHLLNVVNYSNYIHFKTHIVELSIDLSCNIYGV